ncbi:polyamine-transporting ATPase anne boleyn isoform X2 [Oratosquilla oratoria]|uniref:polyamine-transporting ATPase anne boleyn isoform X2 n=1 Tax=Oratosquilla oratoria TaxID=337810 RepID=UPI003F76B3BF
MKGTAKMSGEQENGPPPLKPDVDYINPGLEEQAEIYGYVHSRTKFVVTWVLITASLGLLRLIFHWLPHYMLYCTHSRCSLSHASTVLIIEYYKKYKRYHVQRIHSIDANSISYEEYSVLGNCTTEASNHSQPLNNLSVPKTLIIPTPTGELKEVQNVKMFVFKKMPYFWDDDQEIFYKLTGLDQGHTAGDLHCKKGLPWTEQMRRRLVYGFNAIKVPITPIYKLLFLEAINPFYIFQVASVILWYTDDYYYYATVIVITSVVSLSFEVLQMHSNQMSLQSTIHSSDVVDVVRGEGVERIPSEHLVPGDVIVVPKHGGIMHCDAVLLQGNAIVNESMLTGESVPVTKTPLINRRDVLYSDKEHNRHTLYCGTQVIQTRFYGGERVTAVVIRTGFMTSKGSLVRSILYPPPVDFKFQQDSYKFVGVLASIAFIGFLYTIVTKFLRGRSASSIALDALDLITIVVPPALPMAMTVGIIFAIRRLEQHEIFCISPRSINISGVLNCVCFDKTGTLTEDGLDMKGVIPVEEHDKIVRLLGSMTVAQTLPHDHLLYCMTTCHSITLMDQVMVGDPLDVKMFEGTGWVLDEPGLDDTNKYDMMMPSVVRPKVPDVVCSNENVEIEPPLELGILRQFTFTSSLQRMSVITRRLGASNFDLYCKGSPEKIASLSKPASVPDNFHDILLKYTKQGYRVIGLAYKPLKLSYLKAQRVSREEVECDLEFLGLLVLENRLKKETRPIIEQLKGANIRTIMVTGDNLLTALSVGRECGLVGSSEEVYTIIAERPKPSEDKPAVIAFQDTLNPSDKVILDPANVNITMERHYCFAIEGSSWDVVRDYFPDVVPKMVVRGAVFARMNPDQKQQLIGELQSLGYYVGMCGDGANDCGALKAAHAGISLSEAEASVASPFTSKQPNISCVPTLIREGRTALVTSFGVFKYMATYSLTQFVSIMILYSIDSNLTDFQFLYIDLFLITVFAFFFGHSKSYVGPLASHSPPASLLSLAPILSIILHISVIITFQVIAFFHVQQQSWFVPFNSTTSDDILGGHENYAVFAVSQFQYIMLAIVFSRGPPFRQPLYTNYWLTGSLVIMTLFNIFITIAPTQEVVDSFEFVMPPDDDGGANWFRWQILLLALANFFLCIVIEYVIVDYLVYMKCRPKLHNIDKSKRKYLAIERDLKHDTAWPPVTSSNVNVAGTKRELMLDAGKLLPPYEPSGLKNNIVTTVMQYQSSL